MRTRACVICERVALARQGLHPDVVYEFPDAYVVLGTAQLYRGYCLLLFKRHVREVHELSTQASLTYWRETHLVGQAIAKTFAPWKMNYENLGNQAEHLHWHVIPRYRSDAMRRKPVWLRPEIQRERPMAERTRKNILLQLQKALQRLDR